MGVMNPLYLEAAAVRDQIPGGDYWGRIAVENEFLNKRVRIGTVLRHLSYCVDLYQVVAAEDQGTHWRGPNNVMFTLRAIHSTALGDLTFDWNDRWASVLHSRDLMEMYSDWEIVSR